MEDETLSRSYEKLPPEDRRTFDRWLKLNVVIGLIFVAGLIAMALAGSRSVEGPDAEVAESAKSSNALASDRRVPRPGLRNVRDSHDR